MSTITVTEQVADEDGWIFDVRVKEGESESRHTVSLRRDYYDKFAPLEAQPLTGQAGSDAAAALVKKSFEFLLSRESKEAILSSFALSDITKYFPDFESNIT